MTGCYNLGSFYVQGTGVVQNKVQAVALFQKACDGGIMQGCYNLGVHYEHGTGVAKDLRGGVLTGARPDCRPAGHDLLRTISDK